MLKDDDQLSIALGSSEGSRKDSHADHRPLAERRRPTTLNEYVGQTHLLADDKPLGILARQRSITSMVLWGPPGTGKTTLARLLVENAGADLIGLSAVLSGVKDIRAAVTQAEVTRQSGQQSVLFVDEVHRFNKAQQDAFLPHVESGALTFIGATTENPSFEVNSALLSRARVFVLKPLESNDLEKICEAAVVSMQRKIDAQARNLLVARADGDARRLLNVLELAAQFTDGEIHLDAINAALGEGLRRFDKGGDEFYEQISALHKSIRGSDPDASLYWFCRMLDGGADPRYIGRRLVRLAAEDIGNADPRALQLALAAVESYERLGSPEGELSLAQAVLYLASVPKSDATYQAFNAAMALVRNSPSHPVPMHLRNAPTALMKDMGYGRDYRHAHNEQTAEGAYAAGEHYFPDGLSAQQFYHPTDQGLERQIRERLARLKSLQRAEPEG